MKEILSGRKFVISAFIILLIVLLSYFYISVNAETAKHEIDLTTVESGTYESDYTVKEESGYKLIEIAGEDKVYQLSGTMTGHVIVSADCKVILNNATITAGEYVRKSVYNGATDIGTSAISIENSAECTLTLKDGTSNTLTGYDSTTVDSDKMLPTSAIYVQNTVSSNGIELATLIIDGNGKLTANGKQQCPAIGGNVNRATGSITINSGTIVANSGTWAPGIGDGDSVKSRTDLVTWSCGDVEKYSALKDNGEKDGAIDSDGDKKTDTSMPAKIEINGGDIKATATDQATPGIGTSDELSGASNGDGSGVKDRVWKGLSIEINGSNILTIGGTDNPTSIGAGKFTVIHEDAITVNTKRSEDGADGTDDQTKLISISKDTGYAIHNSGFTADQGQPNINTESTANVFSFKYNKGVVPEDILFYELIGSEYQLMSDFPQNVLNSLGKSLTVKGLSVVLPDGSYKVAIKNADGSLAEIDLEGGGMVYGDASTGGIYSVHVEAYKNSVSEENKWLGHGKTYVLKKVVSGSETGSYLTETVVGDGTYNVYERTGTEGNYSYTLVYEGAEVKGESVKVPVIYYTVIIRDEDGKIIDEQNVIGDTDAEVPEKDGYTIIWVVDGEEYTDEELKEKLKNVDEPLEIQAYWKPNEYTVDFNINAPDSRATDGEMSSQTIVYDEKTALNENKFTVEGYTFKGWSLKAKSVYSSGSTKSWEYSDKDIMDMTKIYDEISDDEVNLYAVWEATKSISGKATIEYSYDDGNERVTIKDELREKEITLVVQRRIIGSDSLFYPVEDKDGNAVTIDVTFEDGDIKDTNKDGKEWIIGEKAVDLSGLAASDDDGEAYEYQFVTTVHNYGYSYIGNNNLDILLSYNPNCFTVDFKISSAEIPSGVRPDKVYAVILYRDHEEDSDGSVISQHANSAAVAEKDESGNYVGSYEVWISKSKDNESLYDYQIQIVSVEVDGKVIELSKSTFIDGNKYGDWVYYDKDKSKVNATMTGTLKARSYDITYDKKGGEFSKDAPNTFVYGTGLSSLPEPEKDCYRFGGWEDESGNTVTEISDTQSTNIKLTAKWIAVYKVAIEDDLKDYISVYKEFCDCDEEIEVFIKDLPKGKQIQKDSLKYYKVGTDPETTGVLIKNVSTKSGRAITGDTTRLFNMPEHDVIITAKMENTPNMDIAEGIKDLIEEKDTDWNIDIPNNIQTEDELKEIIADLINEKLKEEGIDYTVTPDEIIIDNFKPPVPGMPSTGGSFDFSVDLDIDGIGDIIIKRENNDITIPSIISTDKDNIVNIPTPVAGNNPAKYTEVELSQLLGGYADCTKIVWSPSNSKFKSGKTYKASVTLKAKDGSYFDRDFMPVVPGGKVSNVVVSEDGTTVTFDVTYELAGNTKAMNTTNNTNSGTKNYKQTVIGENPPTGDSFNIGWLILCFMAMIMVIVSIKKKVELKK